MSIKVFFADDHKLIVDGFKTTLKEEYGIEVIDVAYTLDGLAQRVAKANPDVLVIDVRFDKNNGQEDGLDVAESILAENRNAKIVVFSQFDDDYLIEKAYKLGILAFVKKSENIDVLVKAIITASTGKEFFPPNVAQQLAYLTVIPNPSHSLDEQELQVFKLIADGALLGDVCKEIGLSGKTVGNIVKNIKHKLNIESQADFTKLAIKHGLTTLDLRKKN